MRPDLHRYIYAAWATAMIVWLAGIPTAKRTVRKQSGLSRLVQVGGALLAAWVFGQPWHVLSGRFVPVGPVTAWTGLALTVAGIAFALVARFYLGRNWSGTVTIKEDHELIRTGPYAMVRNPIYTGFLLGALGTAIAYGRIRGLVAVGIAVLVMMEKIRLEEKFMRERFGAAYERYQREVKRLIPRVW